MEIGQGHRKKKYGEIREFFSQLQQFSLGRGGLEKALPILRPVSRDETEESAFSRARLALEV